MKGGDRNKDKRRLNEEAPLTPAPTGKKTRSSLHEERLVVDESPTRHRGSSVSVQDRSKGLEVLKRFDLNYKYGPCTGLTRMERWDRALKLGLNPPPEIPLLIHQLTEHERSEEKRKEVELHLWNQVL